LFALVHHARPSVRGWIARAVAELSVADAVAAVLATDERAVEVRRRAARIATEVAVATLRVAVASGRTLDAGVANHAASALVVGRTFVGRSAPRAAVARERAEVVAAVHERRTGRAHLVRAHGGRDAILVLRARLAGSVPDGGNILKKLVILEARRRGEGDGQAGGARQHGGAGE